MKAIITTIDEEFEKARRPGAKDKKKRKSRKMSITEIMKLKSQGLLSKQDATALITKIPGWEKKVAAHIKEFQSYKVPRLEKLGY